MVDEGSPVVSERRLRNGKVIASPDASLEEPSEKESVNFVEGSDDRNEESDEEAVIAPEATTTAAVDGADGGGGQQLRVRTAVCLLVLIFLVSLSALLAVYFSFPTLDE